MNNLIVQIYNSTSAKYLKFKKRLDKNIASGRFKRFTQHKKSQLLHKLERLRRRLLQLQTQLKLAAAGVAVSLFLNVNTVEAQTAIGPFTQNDPDNPLPPPSIPFIERPAPTYVDLDGDGDLDLVVGSDYDGLSYFKNVGSKSKPRFLEVKSGDPEYPFNIVDSSLPQGGSGSYNYSTTSLVPAFADVDGDGDYDLLVGADQDKYYGFQLSGPTYFFQNNGTASTPDFGLVTGTGNPFGNISAKRFAHPTFVDMDNDGDQDLWVGGYYDRSSYHFLIQYFENRGTPSAPIYENSAIIPPKHPLLEYSVPVVNNLIRNGKEFPSTPPYDAPLAFADLDKDGDLDFFISISGKIIYYRNDDGVFKSEYNDPTQTGPWVPNPGSPGSSQGNPFDAINDVISASNNYTSFSFADLDDDGDLDVTLGYSYTLFYYENKGLGVFEDKGVINNPLNGVDLIDDSHSTLADIDGDGDIDILTAGNEYANKYFNSTCSCFEKRFFPRIKLFTNQNGVYTDVTGTAADPFSDLAIKDSPKLKLFDVDSDGDTDLLVSYYETPDQGLNFNGDTQYFENVDGAYTERIDADNPFTGLSSTDENNFDLGDLNGDGKPDLFLSVVGSTPALYENTGTIAVPVFTLNADWAAGFSNSYDVANPKFIDIDHDGDLDIILGKYYFGTWYAMNTGTSSNPSFVEIFGVDNPFDQVSIDGASPNLLDFDGDGDLDLLSGDYDGRFTYFENTNPAPVTDVKTSLNFLNLGSPVILDATLTVDDSDIDAITKATVTIANFRPGDEILSFIPFESEFPINGSFSATTGVLTLIGSAPVADYQVALRSVSYQFIGTAPSGRLSSGRAKAVTLNRSIAFNVFDQDFTTPLPQTLAVQISFNQAPVITAPATTVGIGNSVTIDLATAISDPDYNLDATTFKVISPPLSGAPYTINGLAVTIDYTGKNFAGIDQLTVEICDLNGACSQTVLSVNVVGDVVAFNGISPNGDGLNDFFELRNITILEPSNKVLIFSRWGDKVFEVDDYDNDQKKFIGLNNNGNELTSGVYFYRIEFASGKETMTGYITIKR